MKTTNLSGVGIGIGIAIGIGFCISIFDSDADSDTDTDGDGEQGRLSFYFRSRAKNSLLHPNALIEPRIIQ